MIASFEKYNSRTSEAIFEIDGRPYCAKTDAMKGLIYQNIKPGTGINA